MMLSSDIGVTKAEPGRARAQQIMHVNDVIGYPILYTILDIPLY